MLLDYKSKGKGSEIMLEPSFVKFVITIISKVCIKDTGATYSVIPAGQDASHVLQKEEDLITTEYVKVIPLLTIDPYYKL